MTLTPEQQSTAVFALDLAAERYKADGVEMRLAGQPRLAEQFERQYDEAHALARLIENFEEQS